MWGGAVLEKLGAMTEERAQGAHLGVGAEGGRKQPQGVELLQPLAVMHVRLATGHVLDVVGVDQVALDAARFEQFEDGDPVRSRRFHRYAVDAAGEPPVGKGLQVGGEGGATAHRLAVEIGTHGGPDLAGADVEAGGVGVDEGQGFEG